MILVRNGIIASSFNNNITPPSSLWNENNFDLTASGTTNGGTWIDSTTLEFTGFSGGGNDELFQYTDTISGVPDSAGKAVELTVEFDVSGGEIVYRIFDINGDPQVGSDSYFYPQTNGEILTVTSQPLIANFRGVVLFDSFGASPPFRVLDLQIVTP